MRLTLGRSGPTWNEAAGQPTTARKDAVVALADRTGSSPLRTATCSTPAIGVIQGQDDPEATRRRKGVSRARIAFNPEIGVGQTGRDGQVSARITGSRGRIFSSAQPPCTRRGALQYYERHQCRYDDATARQTIFH